MNGQLPHKPSSSKPKKRRGTLLAGSALLQSSELDQPSDLPARPTFDRPKTGIQRGKHARRGTGLPTLLSQALIEAAKIERVRLRVRMFLVYGCTSLRVNDGVCSYISLIRKLYRCSSWLVNAAIIINSRMWNNGNNICAIGRLGGTTTQVVWKKKMTTNRETTTIVILLVMMTVTGLL